MWSRRAHRSTVVRLVVATLLAAAAGHGLRAHGTEARRVELLTWNREHIVRVVGANRSELGLNGSKVPSQLRTIAGRSCLFGDLFAFDVEDAYAFDVDEAVDVTITYAPELTQPFRVAWNRNGGDGFGQSNDIVPEAGAALRQATVRLDRARLAGFGILKTDFAVAARGGMAVCDVAIARSGDTKPAPAAGTVRITVEDAGTGRIVPARLGLYDGSGRIPLPSDQSIPMHRYADETRLFWVAPQLHWPATHRQAFYVDGRYEARVPSGVYQLVATKGPEYRSHTTTVTVQAGKTTTVTVPMRRHIDQPSRGWFSGDTHLHLMRDVVDDLAVWGQVAAEDVHVGNLLEMGNIVTTHFRQPAWGAASRFARDGHVIASGQEDPRTTQRGHTIHHNLRTPVHLSPDEFFSYHKVFEASHAQGGVSGYAHHGRLFNGRRGLALDVPFGLVDFIEVLQGGRLDTDAWYPFLNLGFKVSPAAGSDYPYFGPSLPGAERYYVKLDRPFDVDAWYQSFRAGHVFVTNGPMLELTANGQGMGDEVAVSKGARVAVVASALLNPDIDALDRVELIAQGEVIATARANGQERIELRHEIVADRSQWIAVRAFGRREAPPSGQPGGGITTLAATAHSAPIYVSVDGQPFWKTDAVPQVVAEQRQHLTDLMTAPVDPMGDLEAWETVDVLARQWERQRFQLRSRIDEAHAKYEDIRKRAAGTATAALARRDYAPGVLVVAMTALLGARAWRLRKAG